MAFIGIAVPHATARLFGEIDVPGDKSAVGAMHITIMYVGKNVAIDVLGKAMEATYAVASKTRPFTVRASRVASFPIDPDDEDGHPVIARVDSDALHTFRNALVASFDELGVEYDNKFPVYRPHVTLSYADEAVEEFTIPTLEWGAHEIVLWGGDTEDRRLSITFPLSMGLPNDAVVTAMATRVVDRFRSAAVAHRYSSRSIRQ